MITPSSPSVSSAQSAVKKVISDRLFKDIERLINTNIHELVFALHHAEEDDPEPALDALHQVRMNVDTIYGKVARARTRAIKTPEAP